MARIHRELGPGVRLGLAQAAQNRPREQGNAGGKLLAGEIYGVSSPGDVVGVHLGGPERTEARTF